MGRRRLTEEQWRDLVREQRDRGLSVEAFCRRRKVAVSTFFAWRRKLASSAEPAFVELTVQADEADEAESAPIELVLPGGVTVRVQEGFSATVLRQVVEALS